MYSFMVGRYTLDGITLAIHRSARKGNSTNFALVNVLAVRTVYK
jgi:hypothetical protein